MLKIMKKRGLLNYEQSYSCPSVIGQRKEMVELFVNNLKGRVGPFEMIYTRTDEGRRMLLKCRKRSFLTQNEKMLKKKKIISKYE